MCLLSPKDPQIAPVRSRTVEICCGPRVNQARASVRGAQALPVLTNGMPSTPCRNGAAFEPYANNGGTVVAVAGRDFCIVAADSRLSDGYSILSRNVTRIHRLSGDAYLATAGCWADTKGLLRTLMVSCCPLASATANDDRWILPRNGRRGTVLLKSATPSEVRSPDSRQVWLASSDELRIRTHEACRIPRRKEGKALEQQLRERNSLDDSRVTLCCIH